MPAVKGRREYSSPLRDERAVATGRAIIRAAHELFVERGFGATTVDQIAARARVSKPTVFTAVGNKQDLLRAVRDVAIAGDDEPVPVSQRPASEAIRAEPDRGRAAALLARHLTGVARRYGLIYDQVRAAASSGEAALRELWRTEEAERLIGAGAWFDVLRSKAPRPRRVERQVAIDALWLLMAPDNYNRLVRERGWSERRFQQWLTDQILWVCGGD